MQVTRGIMPNILATIALTMLMWSQRMEWLDCAYHATMMCLLVVIANAMALAGGNLVRVCRMRIIRAYSQHRVYLTA